MTDLATDAGLTYRWSREAFVRAWEAGVFDRRVELVEGEIWPVAMGHWHGDVAADLSRFLPWDGVHLTMSTLPAGDSLLDPDCWACRTGAEPIGSIGSRLVGWRPEDVLLVVEVSDETLIQDLGLKASLYGDAGYPVYWVVTRDGIYEHTEPTPHGYRRRIEYRRGDRIPVDYARTDLAVDDLLGEAVD
jgi:hypothetical protein